jgi:TPR repeat protein
VGEHNLARCLEHGIGVRKDLTKAADHWARSVAPGDPDDVGSLGWYLVEGIGVPADSAKGVALVRRAAEEGSVFAEFVYAGYLETGKGIARDLRAAARSYTRALDRGCLGAGPGYERCSRAGLSQTPVRRPGRGRSVTQPHVTVPHVHSTEPQ